MNCYSGQVDEGIVEAVAGNEERAHQNERIRLWTEKRKLEQFIMSWDKIEQSGNTHLQNEKPCSGIDIPGEGGRAVGEARQCSLSRLLSRHVKNVSIILCQCIGHSRLQHIFIEASLFFCFS